MKEPKLTKTIVIEIFEDGTGIIRTEKGIGTLSAMNVDELYKIKTKKRIFNE